MVLVALLLLLPCRSLAFEIVWKHDMKPLTKCVPPGSKVTITWAKSEGEHNVEHVKEKVWKSCKGITNTAPDSSGTFTWEAPKDPKDHFFVCGVGGHCKMGQKVKITVAENCEEAIEGDPPKKAMVVSKKERRHRKSRSMKKRRKHKRTYRKQRTSY